MHARRLRSHWSKLVGSFENVCYLCLAVVASLVLCVACRRRSRRAAKRGTDDGKPVARVTAACPGIRVSQFGREVCGE